MKQRQPKPLSFHTKLAPGKVIRFKPYVLAEIGWRPGDDLVWAIRTRSQAVLFKKPTESEWRIDRLRRRQMGIKASWPESCPRTFLDWCRLGVVKPYFRKRKYSLTVQTAIERMRQTK
ncbi:MAG: hypothetical protein ABIG35_01230 [Pseudomonadota bacterium]